MLPALASNVLGSISSSSSYAASERALVNVIRHRELFDAALEPRDFCFAEAMMKSMALMSGWFGLTAHDVDVNVLWDLYVALGDGLKEG